MLIDTIFTTRFTRFKIIKLGILSHHSACCRSLRSKVVARSCRKVSRIGTNAVHLWLISVGLRFLSSHLVRLCDFSSGSAPSVRVYDESFASGKMQYTYDKQVVNQKN